MAFRLSTFLVELRRRKVYQVAAVYATVGLAISLAVPDLFGAFDLPSRAARLVIVLIAIGFPIALVLAWAFEVTPEGATRAAEAEAVPARPDGPVRDDSGAGATRESHVLALPKGPVIAVLSFTNLGGNPEDDFFTDGVTEDIITGLTRFTNLFVIARNSTSRFRGQAVDVREVGREFGARYVLEGGIRRSAGHLRVSSQLIDAARGTHLWAETYDRDLTTGEIFAILDDITNRVVATLAGAEGGLGPRRQRETGPWGTRSLSFRGPSFGGAVGASGAWARPRRGRGTRGLPGSRSMAGIGGVACPVQWDDSFSGRLLTGRAPGFTDSAVR